MFRECKTPAVPAREGISFGEPHEIVTMPRAQDIIVRRALYVGLVLSVIVRQPLHAQRGTGIVRDAGASIPLTGAVVSALDSLRNPISRTLSDASGRYSIALPAAVTQLRVVRIGYQPYVMALPKTRADVHVADIAMTRVPTLLSTVLVNDQRICSSDQDRASAISLWEQARAGLLATIVTREAQPAVVTLMSYSRIVDLKSELVLRQTARSITGQTARPFVAGETPAMLARRGYLVEDPAGQRLEAPDADVLTDDSFAFTHCFSVKPPDAEHPGAIGLTFEPTRGRDTLVDVSGVLWMEAGAPALRALEFTYTDAQGVLKRSGAGGTVKFRTMPNGVVFIDDWLLRVPVPDTSRTTVTRVGRFNLVRPRRVTQMSETGGVVLDARWPDGSTWKAPLTPLTGTIAERGSVTPIAGALIALQANDEAVFSNDSGHFTIFPVLPGHYVVDVADTTLAGFLPARVESRTIQVAAGEPLDLRFELEGRAGLIRKLCKDFDSSPGTTTIVAKLVDSTGDIALPKGVQVNAEWLRDPSQPLHETQTVSVDATGRFSLCAVPRDRAVLLSVNRVGGLFAVTNLRTSATAALQSLEWTVNFQALAKAPAPVKAASLRGAVTRAGIGGAVAGADVWLPLLDRHATTDSAGAFTVDGLPAGPLLVQVRSIGYSVLRDTITITAGQETAHAYALFSRATQLDTVHTVASGTQHLSPGLRGFEDRRSTHGGGYFITDSTLRRFGDQPLSSIIMSRVAGVTMVPGRSGASYLVSARKPCSGAVLTHCVSPNCYVTTYIDGVLAYSAGSASGAEPPDIARINVNELAGVEFYSMTGTGPPEYNSTGSGCGTLLLWTRER
jgi:hypothetical protein